MKNLCRQKEISRRAQAAVANARGSEEGRAGVRRAYERAFLNRLDDHVASPLQSH